MNKIQNVPFTGNLKSTKHNKTNVGVALLGDPQKGVTLIGLVTTIILLLILAGITIGVLTGENGIIEKTKYAKTASEIAKEKEAIELSFAEVKTKEILNEGTVVAPENLGTKLKELANNQGIIVAPVEPNENNKIKITYPSGRQYVVEQNGEVNLLDEELLNGKITWGAVSWSNGKASTTINTEQTGYHIEYQIGSRTGTWTRVEKGESVTLNNIENNTTIYARLSDGTNAEGYADITISDITAPTVNVNITGRTTNCLIATVVATDNQTGMATLPTYNYYIKRETDSDYPIEPSYTGTNSSYTFTELVCGASYTIKVTTSDIGGNIGEGTKTGMTATMEPISSVITWGTISWNNGKANIPISINKTEYYIEYKIGNGTWTRGTTKGASITASSIANNTTVYARLSDGTNVGTYTSLLIKDTTLPTVNVSITGTTSDGITATASATDGQTGMAATPTYIFYIKETAQADSTYTQIQSGTSTTCTKAGLKQNTSYTVKVTTSDIGGNTGTKTATGTTGEVTGGTVTGAITYGALSWSAGKANVTINTNQTGYYIEYQVGSTSGTWTRATTKGASITASSIANNTTVYARLSDGTNAGTYTSLLIKDSTAPTVNVSITGTTSDGITAIASATDGQTGMATSPTYIFYIKETAQADSAYTQIQSGTSTTCTKAGLKQNTSYTVKVTTTDIGGNTGTGTKAGTTGEVTGGTVTGAITYGIVGWSAGKASTTINTNQTGYYIEYQVGSIEGTWTRGASKGASITASSIANNATVYARLSDGTNVGTYTSLLIKDTTLPTVNVSITGTTSDGITATASATDGQTGMATSPTYIFYIKETAQADSTYTQIQSGTSTTCTKAGLKQNTSYTVKVTTSDIGGNTGTKTATGTTGEVTGGTVTGAITYGTVGWSGGKASTTISTNQTGYYIEYQVGSTSGTWTRGTTKGASITASSIANNTTVYARLSDGTNAGTYTSLLIKDTTAPTVNVNITGTTSSSITATASATDGQSGIATYNYYIKKTTDSSYPANPSYTGTNASYTFTGLSENTSYTIKVTTTDIAGNTGTGMIEGTKTLFDPTKVSNTVTQGNLTAPIPVGWTASQISGENTISGGLVIYEGEITNWTDVNTLQTTKNQYVWIPVEDINSMVMCRNNTESSVCNLELQGDNLVCTTHTGANTAELCGRLYGTTSTSTTVDGKYILQTAMNFEARNQTFTANSGFREPDILTDTSYADGKTEYLRGIGIVAANGKTAQEIFAEQLQNDFNEMAKSVAKYKGFYIGRYEAGANGATKKNQLVLTAETSTACNYIGATRWYGLYKTIRNTNETITDRHMIWR